MEVRIQKTEATRVAARVHEGPYEGLADVVEELVRWLRNQKDAGGAVTTVFHDPQGLQAGVATGAGDEQAEQPIRAEVWVPVPSESGPEAPERDETIDVKSIPRADAACVTYTGDPLGIPHMALALRGFLKEQEYPLTDETRVVHLMPDWENPAQWVAEVQVLIGDPETA